MLEEESNYKYEGYSLTDHVLSLLDNISLNFINFKIIKNLININFKAYKIN